MCHQCDARNAKTTEDDWVAKRVKPARNQAPAGALITATAIRNAAEREMLHAVQDMRERGWSWEVIGRSMGMTKQGASQWYKRATASAPAPEQPAGPPADRRTFECHCGWSIVDDSGPEGADEFDREVDEHEDSHLYA